MKRAVSDSDFEFSLCIIGATFLPQLPTNENAIARAGHLTIVRHLEHLIDAVGAK